VIISSLSGGSPRGAVPRSANDMERVTQLDYLAIEPGPYFHLTYGFRSEVGWDDAMLSVKVENWRVTPESLDD